MSCFLTQIDIAFLCIHKSQVERDKCKIKSEFFFKERKIICGWYSY